MKRFSGVLFVLLLVFSLLAFPGAVRAASFTVTNISDSGPGSLRQAILDANTSPGTDTITFNIPGVGPHSIQPTSALPTITDPVIIDGYTQPGASHNTNPPGMGLNTVLMIELDCSIVGWGTGLNITGGNSTVRGLVINRFSGWAGIQLGSNNNVIEGNFIGTDVTGTSDLGNWYGVLVDHSANNLIGGTTAEARNLISGSGQGIRIEGNGANSNVVQGNFIGTDVSGTATLGNSIGVHVTMIAKDNVVGGTASGAGNVISGNEAGVALTHAAAGTLVQGNFIGTDVTGTLDLGNSGHGVYIYEAWDNTIGGTSAGTGNTIAFNGGDGVHVSGRGGIAILSNCIFSNVGLGINLGNDAVTPNDLGDGDTGANNLQNFPVLTSVTTGSSTTIEGTLNSTLNTQFRLEFFSNSSCDPSGHGEGERFLGFTDVTTDSSGDVGFVVTFPDTIPTGHSITATATDPNNNTSEFSACFWEGQADLAVTKIDSADPVIVGDNVSYTIEVTNRGPSDATGVMLTDTLPAAVTFVSATATQGSCTESAGVVTCDLGNLVNGASATVEILVTTTTVETVTNTANVTASSPDQNVTNNTAAESTRVRAGPITEVEFTVVPSPTTANLMSVDMVNASDGWAVGDDGTIIHWDGSSWSNFTSPTGRDLRSVFMLSSDDGWAVGPYATILHWDGVQWGIVPTEFTPMQTTSMFWSVSFVDSNNGWAVGDNGSIIHWDGVEWARVTSPTSSCLRSISMVDSADGWAVGSDRTIIRWNGSDWQTVESPVNRDIRSIFMLSSDDGWAVGYAGTIIHWNGEDWKQVGSPVTGTGDLYGVSMANYCDGWAVGGSWLHWDGATRKAFPKPAGCMAVSMVTAGDGWAVGYHGTIIHVTYAPPKCPDADFGTSTISGMVPLSVQFTDQSCGNITSWLWDFGDGETSTEQNPSHSYDASGIFTVALTVTSPDGSDTESKADYIIVHGEGYVPPPWPMFHHDPRHTGRSPYTGPQQNPTLKWSFTTGGDVSSSPAINTDDTIYVGSNDGKLYAINPNGSLKWSFTTGGSIILSSPAIGADGTIYIGSVDKKLYAINPDGSLKWSFTAGGSFQWSSPVIGADGTIYAGSDKLYAINPNGTLKWSYTDDGMGSVRSSPAIGADGTIYVGVASALYAINADGTLKWHWPHHYYSYSSPAIGADGTIYIGSVTGSYGYLRAFNPDGTGKWSCQVGSKPVSYIRSSPAIAADGTIYVGTDYRYLYAINPDGTEKWSSFITWGLEIRSSPAIGADGTIYVGCNDDRLYAVNPDGSVKWSFTTGGDVKSSPAIGADGTIYVGSKDGKLYAIGEPDITVTPLSIDFGSVLVGSSSNPKTVTVTNDGSADLTIGAATISGPEAAEFSIQNDNCSGQTLSPGALATLEVVFSPTSAASKSATLCIPSNDPDESLVEVALSGSAMQIVPATIDFNPDTLNLKSKGKVVTVYIELPEDYDVEEIDISTVMLNGIVPVLAHPTGVGDYDSDGVPDLMVKFDRSDVQDVLEPGNEVEIKLSGELTDGILFEGPDTIRVIEKGKK